MVIDAIAVVLRHIFRIMIEERIYRTDRNTIIWKTTDRPMSHDLASVQHQQIVWGVKCIIIQAFYTCYLLRFLLNYALNPLDCLSCALGPLGLISSQVDSQANIFNFTR